MRGLSIPNKIIFFINSILLLLLILSYLSPYINPNIIWFFSFLGLIFPFLYVLNTFFLIYWLLCFKRQIWANIIILLIGLNHLNNYIGVHPKDSASLDTIKIMSYNVRLFNEYNWINNVNCDTILSFLEKENNDILCIQEFYTKNEIPSIGFKYSHVGKQKKKEQWHMAIYSNFPQINKSTVSIDGKEMNNTCIYSDVVINNDTIRVYNIHLASNWFDNDDYSFIKNPKKERIKTGLLNITKKLKKSAQIRAREAIIIREHINKSPHPVIICGDFNDTPLSFTYSKIKNELIDSFTFSGFGIGNSYVNIPFLRIDYILHDNYFKSYNYKKINKIYSDHYAISTEIKI